MNPMMAALQQSRADNPAPSGAPVPPQGAPMPPQADPAMPFQKMESMIQDVTAKLDKLISAISGQYTGKAEDSENVETDEKEDSSGEAKTFK